MLEQTAADLDRLPPDLTRIAEAMALAMMTADLKQDFIAPGESGAIAADHQAQGTDEWKRAVNAAVAGLLALRRLGYQLLPPTVPVV